MRHPAELGGEQVREFLTALADRGNAATSTQSQALSGLLFLYRQVLGRDLDPVAIVRPPKPVRLPVVLTREEVRALLGAMTGVSRLVAGAVVWQWPPVARGAVPQGEGSRLCDR